MIANVMVTAAGGIIGQGIIKSLKLSNTLGHSPVLYKIFATDSNPLAAGLFRSDTGIIVPHAKSEDYVDIITDVCRRNAISAIFVGSDNELGPLSSAKDEIDRKSGAKVLAAPTDFIYLARDKWKTYEFCK